MRVKLIVTTIQLSICFCLAAQKHAPTRRAVAFRWNWHDSQALESKDSIENLKSITRVDRDEVLRILQRQMEHRKGQPNDHSHEQWAPLQHKQESSLSS